MSLQATSGAASYDAFGGGAPAGPATYIEDVFSTWLYKGTGAAQTITNGIDLSTKGGFVWIKDRTLAENHNVFDTARGAGYQLITNETGAQGFDAQRLSAFTTSGFSLGTRAAVNQSGSNFVSWTFREQPKFFDIVTYTGTGSNTTIAHNLGSVPACIMVKRTDTTGAWQVYHRSLANTEYLVLNTTAAKATGATRWNSTTPTSTVFSLGTDATVNASGGTYVAYIFAHDAGGFGLAGTDNVISCGSYTGNGVVAGPSVTLGYEPQWVLVKSSTVAGSNWYLMDNMRGMAYTQCNELYADLDAAEVAQSKTIIPTATGFDVATTDAYINNNGSTYIYIACRRGPMKVPTLGTSVYETGFDDATLEDPTIRLSNLSYVDTAFAMRRTSPDSDWPEVGSRLIQGEYLKTSSSSASVTSTGKWRFNFQNGFGGSAWDNDTVAWCFRRAPSFHDVVCYTGGTGTPRVLSHNLAVAPELVITKIRNFAGEDWVVNYSNGSTIIGGYLNSTAAFSNSSTAPSTDITSLTSTTYTLNTSNRRVNGAYNYVAYLFATCAGVSKVGSYTGTATTLQIDCGFTAGARFVLIKRTDSTGDWYVWDTARGIVSGNDPYLLLNSTAAEVTSTDYIDTYSAGFEISSTAPAAINASAGTFIFLAIA